MNASRTIRHPETRCKAAFGLNLALAALLACLAVPALARVGEWQVGTWGGGFTAAETNLIAGLAPSSSSGIRNTYGGKNVALLTNGAAVPKVQAATQCLCNNAVLTYTLPEHLLWMENLSPIYRFQPFVDLLKSASDTRVSDIMQELGEPVSEDVPAIQLAKLFLAQETAQLIITDANGRLAGLVSLREFCAKFFWE